MKPIEDELLGDVWPAVEPGTDDRDYGSARLEVSGSCTIRSFQTLTITYTAGKFGLDDTGAIRVAYRFVHDGGPLQTSDPAAPNYVTARASNGTPLSPCVESHGLPALAQCPESRCRWRLRQRRRHNYRRHRRQKRWFARFQDADDFGNRIRIQGFGRRLCYRPIPAAQGPALFSGRRRVSRTWLS